MKKSGVPLQTGIYFLMKGETVIYIGQTHRYPLRLYYHDAQAMPYDGVRFFQCEDSKLDEYEQRWIKMFQPEHNKAFKRKVVREKRKKVIKSRWFMKFRKLTKKSIPGFGMYRDMTVDYMLSTGRKFDVISFYYKLSHISFVDDLLQELGITGDWAIQKPGVDPEKFITFCCSVYPAEFEERRQKMHRRGRRASKVSLQQIGQNNNSKSYHRQFNQQ